MLFLASLVTLGTEARSLTIRPATSADVPDILAMAHAFVASTEYAAHIALSAEHLTTLAERLIEGVDGDVLVAEDGAGRVIGMLALQAFTHPMSGQRIATEFVWWVDPAHRGTAGVRLLRAAEQWAKDAGAAALQMVAPNAHVAAFYEKVGYSAVETSYMRPL
jgi:GNAT superfamily N-acetyltransferase